MPAQKAQGIILRKNLLRETSYSLVIFTREYGKIKGIMKGVRKPCPQFGANFDTITLCDILFYRRTRTGVPDLITSCEAIDYFLPLRKEILRLTYADYFIELINTVVNDYDSNPDIFDDLVCSLRMLCKGNSPKRVARIFEIKLLERIGMAPQMLSCPQCGKESGDSSVFSVKNGGLLCAGCAVHSSDTVEISKGTVNFIRKIQLTDTAKTFRFKVSAEVGSETENILRRFLLFHINKPVNSLKFAMHLESIGVGK